MIMRIAKFNLYLEQNGQAHFITFCVKKEK